MNDLKIEHPIAERKLSLGEEDVFVTIDKPRLFEDGHDYYCPYSVVCGNYTKIFYAAGVDSVQALQPAMKNIGAELSYLGRVRNGTVSWFPDTPGETGFPEK